MTAIAFSPIMSTVVLLKVDNWPEFLSALKDRLFSDVELTFDEALTLTDIPDEHLFELAETADFIRQRHTADQVDLCSIINARSGRCPEDCKFCTQSSHHETDAPVYPMKPVEEIVAAAKQAETKGAHRFCIVTSGDALSDEDFATVTEAVRQIAKETNLHRCASVGALTKERADQLRQAGLSRYHHNVETASSHFPEICSTHQYDDKLETVSHLDQSEIEKCVGGILNLGETARQRIEFAFELKKIDPISVPINFLNPQAGTPLADRPLMSALEALKYLAIFRLVMPKTYIRLAGGRSDTFGQDAALPFKAGVNALLIGDLLTTAGPAVASDLAMLRSLGFQLDGEDGTDSDNRQ